MQLTLYIDCGNLYCEVEIEMTRSNRFKTDITFLSGMYRKHN